MKAHPAPRRVRLDLKAEFVRRRLTVREVARRIGISRETLSNILFGHRGLTDRVAREISLATGIPKSVVLGDGDD